MSEAQYLKSVENIFSKFSKDAMLFPWADGHYARVGEGHVLHFINVPDTNNINKVADMIDEAAEKQSSSLITFDFVLSLIHI